MNMEMGVEGKNIAIDMDGDVGIADPGSPVEINFPNLSEYKDMSGYYTRADLCTTTRSIKIRESDAQIRLHIFC